MSKEEKELLLVDLCARLPYGVIVRIGYESGEPCYGKLSALDIEWFINSKIKIIKPYLRPMSSMTEEERKEFEQWLPDGYNVNTFDWLNANHFDYRGLIPMCLAIEVTEKNNPYK